MERSIDPRKLRYAEEHIFALLFVFSTDHYI